MAAKVDEIKEFDLTDRRPVGYLWPRNYAAVNSIQYQNLGGMQNANLQYAGFAGSQPFTITVGNVLQTSAVASVRCVAGKGQVYATVTNADAATVDLAVSSTYGSKSFTGIATGKSATHSFTTRLASVPEGIVTVQATGSGGIPETSGLTAAYPATSCN